MRKLFFFGNCQARYAAAALAACADDETEVFVVGPHFGSNAALRNKAPTYIANEAVVELRREAPNCRFVAMLQEAPLSTTGSSFLDNFDDSMRFPHLQFRSLWPEEDEDRSNAKRLTRKWHIERLSLKQTFERSGLSEQFFDTFLAANRREIFFHTPSHPTGTALGFVWGGIARIADEKYRPLLAEASELMSVSAGVDINSKHPVDVNVAEALGLEFHRSSEYQILLSLHEMVSGRSPAWELDAESIIRALDTVQDAHFFIKTYRMLRRLRKLAVAEKVLELGRERYSDSSSIDLVALQEACRTDDRDAAERLLYRIATRPFVRITDERAVLRLRNQFQHKAWIARMVLDMLHHPELNPSIRAALKLNLQEQDRAQDISAAFP